MPTATDEEKAKVAAALVDMQLERNGITTKFYNFITSVLVFPAGILGVGWRYERKKVKCRLPVVVFGADGAALGVGLSVQEVEVTEWDDNEIVNVDYFDFVSIPLWCDWNATSLTCSAPRLPVSIPLWCDWNRRER